MFDLNGGYQFVRNFVVPFVDPLGGLSADGASALMRHKIIPAMHNTPGKVGEVGKALFPEERATDSIGGAAIEAAKK
jgi:hypothetical protein